MSLLSKLEQQIEEIKKDAFGIKGLKRDLRQMSITELEDAIDTHDHHEDGCVCEEAKQTLVDLKMAHEDMECKDAQRHIENCEKYHGKYQGNYNVC